MPNKETERLEALERENRQLQRAVDELSILNELSAAIGGARDLEGIMQTIVQRSMRAVEAEQCVITLVNAAAEDPMKTLVRTMADSAEHKALHIDPTLLGWMLRSRAPLLLNKPHNDKRFRHMRWDSTIRSVLCVPMMVQSKITGILATYNKMTRPGFNKEDSRLLSIIAAQSAQVVENARLYEERAEILRVFGQHTAPEVVEALLQTGPALPSQRQRVCVMFLDIRGFTSFSEQRAPETVVDYLNTVFHHTIDLVNRHHGIIHQLLGDGFIALFGAPFSRGNDCQNGLNAALAIVESVQDLCTEKHLAPTKVGIGLHAGEVVAGLVGSNIHKEYKVTGDVVNLAARIEKMTKQYDAQVLVTEAVWDALDTTNLNAEPLGEVEVRGREESVRLYRLA
jgi:class 3 adenylate cyclase